MAWFRRKKTVEDREPSPERENGDNGSVTSAQTGTTGKRKFKDRFQNKNRWYWKFVQQRLPGWAPILTANGVVAYFFGMCLLCIAIGVPVLIASLNIQQYSTRYDSVPPFNTNRDAQQSLLQAQSGNGVEITTSILVTDRMEAPVYVFYELGKYYQNHKRYVRSRADEQLGGDGDAASACAPEQYVNQSSDANLPNNGQIDPCGLTAWSFFNDTYSFTSTSTSINVDSSNIAWSYDRNHLYGSVTAVNYNIFPDKRGGNTTTVPINQNEHLMVWLRPAAKPTLRKLYGVINTAIPAGTTVNITVQNRYNTYNYGGQKRIILTTNSWVGGRNLFMGIAYLVVAGLAFIAAMVFLCCYHLGFVGRRKFGDLNQLSWNRKQ